MSWCRVFSCRTFKTSGVTLSIHWIWWISLIFIVTGRLLSWTLICIFYWFVWTSTGRTGIGTCSRTGSTWDITNFEFYIIRISFIFIVIWCWGISLRITFSCYRFKWVVVRSTGFTVIGISCTSLLACSTSLVAFL